MTISRKVHQDFLDQHHEQLQVICIPPTKRHPSETSSPSNNATANSWWTAAEHDRFLQAIKLFPRGPWKAIADFVGNKTARQAMTHGQKYRQKIARRKRGLQMSRHRRQTIEQKVATAVEKEYMLINDHACSSINYHPILPYTLHPTALICPESPTEVSAPGTPRMVPEPFALEFHSHPHVSLLQSNQTFLGDPFGPHIKDLEFHPFNPLSLQLPTAFQLPLPYPSEDAGQACSFVDQDINSQQWIRDLLEFLEDHPASECSISTLQ